MKKLLSGNEAIALGAYHAGVKVAAAYPGTPSTEILENLARFKDIYAEWSTNEKVAMEVALGASYSNVRSMVSMKQVGLNVAVDPFMAAATTGIEGGLLVVCADDPGVHSSQNEQDNRHYAKLAKVPMLEPSDSQEAYDFTSMAFDISEQFDTPVLLITTTRVSHSKSVVEVTKNREEHRGPIFRTNIPKYVMLPVYARQRHVAVEERLSRLEEFAESFQFNQFIKGKREVGIISSSAAYQYAREVLPGASYLKLGMTYPLPRRLIERFAEYVKTIVVVEELDPFLEDNISSLGIKVTGKKFIPRCGELNADIVEQAFIKAGVLKPKKYSSVKYVTPELPQRPPLFCPGCPHMGISFILSTMGKRSKLLDKNGVASTESGLVITGDIGCYTLATNPPYRIMDTTACMGASIGQAIGVEKAGVASKVIALIGDSTFLHSGITGVVDAVYNDSGITIVILDNGTTAMTGHQDHPGTGVTAQGKKTRMVRIEDLVKGIGVNDVRVVNAFDIKTIRDTLKSCIDNPELSVMVVRGSCAIGIKNRQFPRKINIEKCNRCFTCLQIGCNAIKKQGEDVVIDVLMCMGDNCAICQQICPTKAIERTEEN